jgi:hypothetical protein
MVRTRKNLEKETDNMITLEEWREIMEEAVALAIESTSVLGAFQNIYWDIDERDFLVRSYDCETMPANIKLVFSWEDYGTLDVGDIPRRRDKCGIRAIIDATENFWKESKL